MTGLLDGLGARAMAAADTLRLSPDEARSDACRNMASAVRADVHAILSANAQDMDCARGKGLSGAMLDRLKLTSQRVAAIAGSLDSIAELPDPIGRQLESWSRPNGLEFSKVTVPIGVIGMVYESRPNVTADAGALCVKSGNAVVLRSGSEALASSLAIHAALTMGLAETGLPEDAIQIVRTPDRAAVGEMLSGLGGAVDLIIPRGGRSLVERVQSEARVPVLAHLDGLNTTYVHASADLDMAEHVVRDAKMRRTGVCGATETVLCDSAEMALRLGRALEAEGCEVRARGVDVGRPATDEDFATEHLAPIVNLAVVDGLDAALAHIARYGSGHTDAILAEDTTAAERFFAGVDSAIVLHNASTQFADGGEFGFGAEIGIATGRLHARGPVGAQHLVTHKTLVRGSGQVRG